MVTGRTAMAIDVSAKLGEALAPYLAVVVGLAFVLLLLVFRSLLVPLKATLGFLLTVAATFGAVVAVFQWGWLAGLLGVAETGPIMSMMPIFLIGVVSASPWTTRSSSSPGCARSTCTARPPPRPSSPGSGTAPASSAPPPSS